MTTIQTRAGRVAYRELGSGPAVLLLHATLHDRHDYDPIVETLARRYRTIAVDWPGHGDSDPVDASMQASAPLFADVLEDVVDGLGLSRASLIGNSVGGFAAARLAINRPEFVAGLVLVNTGGFVRWNPLSRTFCRVLGTPAVFRAAAPLLVHGYMKARTGLDREIAERAIAKAKTADGVRTGTALWRSFPTPGHDLRGRAAELSSPTLIVWGKKDIAIPLSAGRATQKAIRGSRLEVLDTGHVVFSSDPQGFLALAEPFLAAVGLPR
ncbi:alpha/beta hydrolase [Mycobacterium riyadhense]|uniref:Alpha/beta hydrolase n=2 Tax=Mycobacterium riyadhense TaxID=486698 RepID=A0A1X2CZ77_9MYCO|nr:alpha/beta hydrolase [Mycobacterium riyadhense]MCV7147770.1 alpha/beta hydrolase [Mycobacterium riyadhense]ORW81235.1 alpha/beta hydrolase [Mycobacterium riyadhense]VTP01537.1 2-hydroxy-6-oxononadienedioate/2-hydroxy-6-oxononatrienedioate hydrolase [Mycobacterium riyadhense]